MDKSIVVAIERKVKHGLYGKFVKKTSRFVEPIIERTEISPEIAYVLNKDSLKKVSISAFHHELEVLEVSNMKWENRAAIFLKAADLLAGPFRSKLNAATMLGQSKNVMQAEIDAACELIDFFKFNVQYMSQLYKETQMLLTIVI